MTPIFKMTIKANATLNTHLAVLNYIDALIDEHDCLRHYQYALVDVVNKVEDDAIELYEVPEMDGDFVSSTNGTRLLWMPEINRAALNGYQGGDWQWTDADSPEDALRRFHEDDMMP
jgi:hypothetical protein